MLAKVNNMSHFFSPYALLRVSGMPYSTMDLFNSKRTVRMFKELEDTNLFLERISLELNDVLFIIINEEPDDDIRKKFIKIKRNITKGRITQDQEGMELLKAKLGIIHIKNITKWNDLIVEKEKIQKELPLVFEDEMCEIRRNLQTQSNNDEFKKGILLSSKDLFDKIEKFVSTPLEKQNSKLRKIEKMLMTYLSRVATKTSPFSTFTSVLFAEFSKDLDKDHLKIDDMAPQKTEVKINHLLIRHLIKYAELNPDIQPYIPLQINPIYKIKNGKMFVFQSESITNIENLKAAVTKDSFVNFKNSDTILKIINIIQEKEADVMNLNILIDILSNSIKDPEILNQVKSFLHQLISLHVIKCKFNIKDQSEDILLDWVNLLDNISSPLARKLKNRLIKVNELVKIYPTLPSSVRRIKVVEITKEYEECCKLIDAPINTYDPILFEDTSYEKVSNQLSSTCWNTTRNDLSLLQSIVHLFSVNLSHSLSFKEYFKRTYGVGGVCTDILTMFEEYRKFTNTVEVENENSQFNPYNLEVLNEVKKLKEEFTHYILSRNKTNENILEIEDEWVRIFSKKIPEEIRTFSNSFSYFVQPYHDENQETLQMVVNRIASGYGQFMSRFMSFYERIDNELSLSQQIRKMYKELLPRNHIFAEISGVFGFNGNLHKPIAPYEINYPGTVTERPDSEIFSMMDLNIIYSKEHDRLHMVSVKTGEIVHPLYLGFLTWFLLPTIYRLLFLMVPPSFYPLSISDECYKFIPQEERKQIIRFPRIKLNSLVVSREQWWIPNNEIPDTMGLNDLELFATISSWRKKHNIPKDVFMRLSRRGGNESDKENGDKQDLNKFNDANRKPQYIHFENMILIKLFEKNAKQTDDAFIFEEVLPGSDQLHVNGKKGDYVSELIIELNERGTTKL